MTNCNGTVGGARFFASRRNRLMAKLCNVEIVQADKLVVDTLLQGNVGNRKVTRSHYQKLALDFKNGNYRFTGQPIIRNSKGILLDGQHRLLALREAGYPPVTFLLVTLNADDTEAAYAKMDLSKSRGFKTLLEHYGRENAVKVASICKKLTYIATGYTTFPCLPDSYLEDVLKLYRVEIDAIAPLMKIHGFLGDMAAAACAVAKVTGCLDEIVGLILKASSGDMLQIGTPAHTLFKIINCHQFDYRGTTRNAFHFAIVANALIAHLNNEKYPTVNKNYKRALKWINDMARDNQVFILPKKITIKTVTNES